MFAPDSTHESVSFIPVRDDGLEKLLWIFFSLSKSNYGEILNFCGRFLRIFFSPPSLKDHDQFVNCVRYAPDGSKFVSAGADGKVGHAGWSDHCKILSRNL